MKQAILICLSLCLCSFAQAQELDYIPNHPQYFSDGDSWAYARLLWDYNTRDISEEDISFGCELTEIKGDTILDGKEYWILHHKSFKVVVYSDASMIQYNVGRIHMLWHYDYPTYGFLREDEEGRQWLRFPFEEEHLLWDFSEPFEVGNHFKYGERMRNGWEYSDVEILTVDTIYLEDGTKVLVANDDWYLGYGNYRFSNLLHYYRMMGDPNDSERYLGYFRNHNGVTVYKYTPVSQKIEEWIGEMDIMEFIKRWENGTLTIVLHPNLVIDDHEPMYDLNGCRLTHGHPYGLFVRGGKKYLKK